MPELSKDFNYKKFNTNKITPGVAEGEFIENFQSILNARSLTSNKSMVDFLKTKCGRAGQEVVKTIALKVGDKNKDLTGKELDEYVNSFNEDSKKYYDELSKKWGKRIVGHDVDSTDVLSYELYKEAVEMAAAKTALDPKTKILNGEAYNNALKDIKEFGLSNEQFYAGLKKDYLKEIEEYKKTRLKASSKAAN
jgi:hypothetical protein